MTVIQPPGVQWVVSLLQLKLGSACDIFTTRVQSHVYDMMIGNVTITSWRIMHNNELQRPYGHLGYSHYSNQRQRYCTLSSVEALIEFYMNANGPQTLTDEYSQATKILDTEYKLASLDDVIKTCENLHVEEQHQLKTLLKKYEHLFDGTLGEFNMDPLPFSLQLMNPNCKPVHAHTYPVFRLVEQQLQ
jgi:hypothetical protein